MGCYDPATIVDHSACAACGAHIFQDECHVHHYCRTEPRAEAICGDCWGSVMLAASIALKARAWNLTRVIPLHPN